MRFDPNSEEGMRAEARRAAKRRAKLRQLAFEIAQKPINSETRHDRKSLVVQEPPRWNPDEPAEWQRAKAKQIADADADVAVDVFDYPDVLDRIGGAP